MLCQVRPAACPCCQSGDWQARKILGLTGGSLCRLILFLQQSSVEWASSLWMHVVQELDPDFKRTVRPLSCACSAVLTQGKAHIRILAEVSSPSPGSSWETGLGMICHYGIAGSLQCVLNAVYDGMAWSGALSDAAPSRKGTDCLLPYLRRAHGQPTEH